MKKPLFFALTIFWLTLLACGFNVSTANISQAQLAKDPDGLKPATFFAQDENIYAVVELSNAPDDTTVKAVWTAVEADGLEPDYLIGETSLTSGDGSLHFDLTNENLWPTGNYKVDLYLNEKLDRTLEFTVEGDVSAQAPTPSPTLEPTATPTPAPTVTPEPTNTPVSTAGDSLAFGSATKETATPEEETPEYEPLPFQDEPYVHPSGAFTFAMPEGWTVTNEDESSATIGDGQSYVGAVFTDGEIVYSQKQMQQYIDVFIEEYLSFAEDYQIIEQKAQPDDSIYVALSYSTADGSGDLDFFFEQRNTIVFVLLFDTPVFNELQPTWDEIIASYAVDPDAALAVTTASATPTAPRPATAPPTPTPAPATNDYAPQPGRSRLYVFNEYNHELVFTINNSEHKIAINAEVPIDLDAGRYTFTISIPGGAANDEVTMAPNQSWAVGVRGDGAVYKPFQVYP